MSTSFKVDWDKIPLELNEKGTDRYLNYWYSGIILSARLKALGIDSLIVDRNPQPGDNWALRYDCLRFHIGRHSCATPFLGMFSENFPRELPYIHKCMLIVL